MTKQIDAGKYTVSLGITRGRTHIFITHRETGKQWMSKSDVDNDHDLGFVAGSIDCGFTKFDPDATVQSCDHRFWMPVRNVN